MCSSLQPHHWHRSPNTRPCAAEADGVPSAMDKGNDKDPALYGKFRLGFSPVTVKRTMPTQMEDRRSQYVPRGYGNFEYGTLSFFVNPVPGVQHLVLFDKIISYVGYHQDKLNLALTNIAMYNMIHHNVICWHDGEYCFNEIYKKDDSDETTRYRPVSSPTGTHKLRELSRWKVQIRGLRLEHYDDQGQAKSGAKECKTQTVKALFFLSKLDPEKIGEIEFLNTDMATVIDNVPGLFWETKDGTAAKNQRILDVIPDRFKDPSVNSTKEWRDFRKAEINRIQSGAIRKPHESGR